MMTLSLETRPALPAAAVVDMQMAASALPYKSNRQPSYDDRGALLDAVGELQRDIPPMSDPTRIANLRADLADVYNNGGAIIKGGPCAELVGPGMAEQYAKEATALYSAAKVALGGLLKVFFSRTGWQNGKPRSEELDGSGTANYMGDMVNGQPKADRTPDPRRLVVAGRQAAAIVAMTSTASGGRTIYHAHEGLIIAAEAAGLRSSDATGEVYASTGDMVWIGDRTRDPEGEHVSLLSQVMNPVGVKLGPDSRAQDVFSLAECLDPRREDGKLVFMIRVGDNKAAMDEILGAVRQLVDDGHKPLVMYDIHGSTQSIKVNGKTVKVRSVEKTVKDTKMLSAKCEEYGLRLHGSHLETQADDSKNECVNCVSELPEDEPVVDPGFDVKQFGDIQRQTADCYR